MHVLNYHNFLPPKRVVFQISRLNEPPHHVEYQINWANLKNKIISKIIRKTSCDDTITEVTEIHLSVARGGGAQFSGEI